MMMITGLITRLMGDFPLIHNIYITQYLGINLTKELKALYLENYRTPKKEIEEDTNNGRIYHVNGLEELTSLKHLYYPHNLQI